ncbi:hypothetical protein [Stackebrandtia nassauensis]|uniref:Uncharacterized protein n=1 Tax=Stackebrandtia nassauensis (strain DSM 44728 / CIP 108903 / NRRL B-16338 / NBRC 102104 / LLR-40K-21) TaxID=446470 RepID=D3Q1C3_STANL|nr:hypothetical protein [Stackebrandtia nassauensis]ADD45703.1 hypothetical protein Snas_6079 [Stackebrandtia nassauensis DSM 44728]
MRHLTPYERRLTRMQEEISGNERMSVWEEHNDGLADLDEDAEPTLRMIADKYGMELAPHFHQSFVRFNCLWTRWRIEDAELNGEFRIGNLPEALATPPPPFSVRSSTLAERQLHTELRVIDDKPDSGSGHQATLRLQPGTSDPELWYFHLGRGTLRMDINYQEYLDALILTKGTSGWQFLFCDITKELRTDYDFTTAARDIKTMLDVFPELFPNHDYSGLRARLEERL